MEVRTKLGLDSFDRDADTFEVLVPEHIISLNSSFFQGLFGSSVRTLGEINFRKKYVFRCSDVVVEDVGKGIVDALNQSNPLS